jgi:hypothetical protein
MADFADDENVQRTLECASHLRRNDHAASWQPQDNVGLNIFVTQPTSQFIPGVLAGFESHRLLICHGQ